MYIGLDLGTSGLKAIVIDAKQYVLASAHASYDVNNPHSGWSEQDPERWTQACDEVMRSLGAQVDLSAVRAISFSGHMHGAVMLGADDQVLAPCILWNDTRAAIEAQAMDDDPSFRAITGNIVFPGFTAPKLKWVENNRRDIFEKITTIMLPKDYLRFWLSGEKHIDISDAAGTALLDMRLREWSADLLAKTNIRRDQVPDLIEASDVEGQLRPDLAQKWGLSPSTKIAAGGADNAAAAMGAGCLSDGDGFISLGTSGVLFAARDDYVPDPASAVHSFCHAAPNKWYQMGVMLSATDSLNWLSRITGQSAADLAHSVTATRPSFVRFLPYLGGERTPHNDTQIRGSFTGLETATTPADLAQAVMEGVSFAIKDNFDALTKTGARFDDLLAMGGGSKSKFWLQTIATLTNTEIAIPVKGELGAALGAARLAFIGDTGNDIASIVTKPPIQSRISPDASSRDAYLEAHRKFKASYASIRAIQ